MSNKSKNANRDARTTDSEVHLAPSEEHQSWGDWLWDKMAVIQIPILILILILMVVNLFQAKSLGPTDSPTGDERAASGIGDSRLAPSPAVGSETFEDLSTQDGLVDANNEPDINKPKSTKSSAADADQPMDPKRSSRSDISNQENLVRLQSSERVALALRELVDELNEGNDPKSFLLNEDKLIAILGSGRVTEILKTQIKPSAQDLQGIFEQAIQKDDFDTATREAVLQAYKGLISYNKKANKFGFDETFIESLEDAILLKLHNPNNYREILEGFKRLNNNQVVLKEAIEKQASPAFGAQRMLVCAFNSKDIPVQSFQNVLREVSKAPSLPLFFRDYKLAVQVVYGSEVYSFYRTFDGEVYDNVDFKERSEKKNGDLSTLNLKAIFDKAGGNSKEKAKRRLLLIGQTQSIGAPVPEFSKQCQGNADPGRNPAIEVSVILIDWQENINSGNGTLDSYKVWQDFCASTGGIASLLIVDDKSIADSLDRIENRDQEQQLRQLVERCLYPVHAAYDEKQDEVND